jgi:DNA-binding MarR family transcriptional regulator
MNDGDHQTSEELDARLAGAHAVREATDADSTEGELESVGEPADDDMNTWLDDRLALDAELGFPPRRGRAAPPRAAFTSLHAAYHLLARRLEHELRDSGLTASEAVVLVAASRVPGGAIKLSREEAGLRPSTMTSVFDRLARNGLVQRERSNQDHRFVGIWLTPLGKAAAAESRAALHELDAMLGEYVRPSDLAAACELFEASHAIALRGSRARY